MKVRAHGLTVYLDDPSQLDAVLEALERMVHQPFIGAPSLPVNIEELITSHEEVVPIGLPLHANGHTSAGDLKQLLDHYEEVVPTAPGPVLPCPGEDLRDCGPEPPAPYQEIRDQFLDPPDETAANPTPSPGKHRCTKCTERRLPEAFSPSQLGRTSKVCRECFKTYPSVAAKVAKTNGDNGRFKQANGTKVERPDTGLTLNQRMVACRRHLEAAMVDRKTIVVDEDMRRKWDLTADQFAVCQKEAWAGAVA